MGDRWEDWFEPGEELLWEGAPVSGIRHPFRNVFMTAFGVPFLLGGVMTFGTGVGLATGSPNLFGFVGMIGLMAFSLPFLSVGTGLMVGPWLHDALKHRRVRYALSTRAGYIATQWWNRQMSVLPIAQGTPIELDEARNGVGSVWFHFQHTLDSDGDAKTERKGFEGIADVRSVFALVKSVASKGDEGRK